MVTTFTCLHSNSLSLLHSFGQLMTCTSVSCINRGTDVNILSYTFLSASLLSSFLSFSLNCLLLLGPCPARPSVVVARAPLRQVHSARLGSYFSVWFCCLFSSSLFPSVHPSFYAQPPRFLNLWIFSCFICFIFQSNSRKPIWLASCFSLSIRSFIVLSLSPFVTCSQSVAFTWLCLYCHYTILSSFFFLLSLFLSIVPEFVRLSGIHYLILLYVM